MVTTSTYPRVGGKEQYIRLLARELAKTYHVRVVSTSIVPSVPSRLRETLFPSPTFAEFEDDGYRVIPLRLSLLNRLALLPTLLVVVPVVRRYAYGPLRLVLAWLYWLVMHRRLRKLLSGARVVHLWDSSFLGFAATRVARALRACSISIPLMHPGSYGDDILARQVYKECNIVVGLTKTESAVYEGFGARSCVILPPVISCDTDLDLPDESRCGCEEGPTVVFVGENRPCKGAGILPEALTNLRRKGNNVAGCFVGPGTESIRGDGVHGHGTVTTAEKRRLIGQALALCLPSEFETFGLVLGEAWLEGVPCIVADIPTLREVAELSGGAIVAPRSVQGVSSAIQALLSNDSLRNELAVAGHRFATEHLHPQQVERQHRILIRDLLKTTVGSEV